MANGVTRISAQQQKAAGFDDPREFSRALTQMENQARDFTRQGRSIIRGEGGTTPEFNVAELEQTNTDITAPPASTAVEDTARDISQSAVVEAQNALSQQEQQTLDRSEQVEQGQETQNRLLESLQQTFGEAAQIGQTEQQLRKEAGIPEVNQEVTEIQNKILTKEREFDNRIRSIREDRTIPAAQKQAAINQAQTEKAQELADLSIIEQTKLNRLENAQAMVQRKVDLLTKDIETRLQAQKFFFDVNQDRLTTEETRQFQRILKKEERAFQTARSRIEKLEDAKFSIASNASFNNAPASVLENIQKAETPEEAVTAAGKFGMDPQTIAQIDNVYSQIRERRLARQSRTKKRRQAQQEEQQERNDKVEAALTNLGIIENIYSKTPDGEVNLHPGLNESVGFGVGKTFRELTPFVQDDPESAIAGTDKADFIATHKQIKDTLTLKNLKLMSGPLSDSDIDILRNAASRLSLNLSEDEYIKELEKIHSTFERTVQQNGVTDGQAQFYFGLNPEDIEGVNEVYGEPQPQDGETIEKFNPAQYYNQ